MDKITSFNAVKFFKFTAGLRIPLGQLSTQNKLLAVKKNSKILNALRKNQQRIVEFKSSRLAKKTVNCLAKMKNNLRQNHSKLVAKFEHIGTKRQMNYLPMG